MAVNQYVNKVVYGGNTIIDISDTTAVASDVAQGKYFYTLAGQKVQGTATGGSGTGSITQDQDGYLVLDDQGSSGGGGLECGTFTLATDSKTFTIQHSLGVIPDFCIIYPINVPTATSTYRICFEVILRNLGQSDYNISNYSATYAANHIMHWGVGYSLTANPGASAVHNITDTSYAGGATTSTFVVGGVNLTASGGTISAGEYGYILGVVS